MQEPSSSPPEQADFAAPSTEQVLRLIKWYRFARGGPWNTVQRRDPLLVQKIRALHAEFPNGLVLVSGEGDNERGSIGTWMRTGPDRIAVGIFHTSDAEFIAMAHDLIPALVQDWLRLKELETTLGKAQQESDQKEEAPALPSTNTEAGSSEGGGIAPRRVKIFEPPPKGGGAVLE